MRATRTSTPSASVGCFMLGIVVIATVLMKSAESADTLYLCMKNCEQCKSMYGAYFEGDLCAKSCFRAKGAFIPDCIDISSIGNFLNKNE